MGRVTRLGAEVARLVGAISGYIDRPGNDPIKLGRAYNEAIELQLAAEELHRMIFTELDHLRESKSISHEKLMNLRALADEPTK